MPYLTPEQLSAIPFASIGTDVHISDKVSLYRPEMMHLGSHIRIDDYTVLSAGDGGLRIGHYAHIGCFVGVYGQDEVVLDDFIGLSSRVAVYSTTDDYSGEVLTNPTVPMHLRRLITAPVRVGRHVVVGTGATIMPGVTLHDGCAVGAHSLVLDSFGPGVIVAGTPARVLKERSGRIFELEKELMEFRKQY